MVVLTFLNLYFISFSCLSTSPLRCLDMVSLFGISWNMTLGLCFPATSLTTMGGALLFCACGTHPLSGPRLTRTHHTCRLGFHPLLLWMLQPYIMQENVPLLLVWSSTGRLGWSACLPLFPAYPIPLCASLHIPCFTWLFSNFLHPPRPQYGLLSSPTPDLTQ